MTVWLCSQNDIGSILYPILLTFFTILSLVTVGSDKEIQQYSEILVMIVDVMFYRYYVFLKFKLCKHINRIFIGIDILLFLSD